MKTTAIAVLFAATLSGCFEQRNKSIEAMNQGVAAFNNKLYEAAEKKLREAVTIDPSNSQAYQNLGKVLQEQKKWDKAAEALSEAVRMDDSNAQLHYDLGWS